MVTINQPALFSECLPRLIQERERLGLSQAQFACLAGVSLEDQVSLESGKWDNFPKDYLHGAQEAGADPLFILGHSSESRAGTLVQLAFGSTLDPDTDFGDAVLLLRKSIQAVNAFVGDGAAERFPQLVVAVMDATIKARYACGLGGYEQLVGKISDAISSVGDAITDAFTREDTR
ncbi:hypothetical protein ACUH78_18275 [Thauera sp. ZXT1-4]|uniref:hypothetical protein n=1 Tax=Thauera sp. ZXT1-4 TaxID=3460294 RepID=UPI004040B903